MASSNNCSRRPTERELRSKYYSIILYSLLSTKVSLQTNHVIEKPANRYKTVHILHTKIKKIFYSANANSSHVQNTHPHTQTTNACITPRINWNVHPNEKCKKNYTIPSNANCLALKESNSKPSMKFSKNVEILTMYTFRTQAIKL